MFKYLNLIFFLHCVTIEISYLIMNTVNRPEKRTKGQRASKLTHEELMSKRHQRKKKKVMKKETKSNDQRKKELIEEYNELSKTEFSSNKETAKAIMEIVEEIKDEGLNDKRYLDIMNHIMILHKQDHEKSLDEYNETFVTYNNELRFIRNITNREYGFGTRNESVADILNRYGGRHDSYGYGSSSATTITLDTF